MHRKRHPSIAMEIAQDYVHHVLVVVKVPARDAKEVVRMVVRMHVAVVVAKVVKADVILCVRVTV